MPDFTEASNLTRLRRRYVGQVLGQDVRQGDRLLDRLKPGPFNYLGLAQLPNSPPAPSDIMDPFPEQCYELLTFFKTVDNKD